MNCFEKVIQDYGVNAESHGEHALVYALLKYASADVEGAETESNKVRECTRRLEAAGVGKNALDIIRQKLNSLEVSYDTYTR
jgi:hypothetical protein